MPGAKGLLRNKKQAGLPPKQTRRSVSQPGGRKSHSSALKGAGGDRKRSGAEESWSRHPPFRAEARLTTVLSSPWSVLRSTHSSLPKIDPTLNLRSSSRFYALVCKLRLMAMEKSEGARRTPPLLRWGSMKEAETAQWLRSPSSYPSNEYPFYW